MLWILLACAPEVEQTPACATFVACQSARDEASGTTTDTVRFTPAGECWGTPAGQDLCDRACTNGLAFLRDRYTDLPDACLE
jgi:hypothetical protein